MTPKLQNHKDSLAVARARLIERHGTLYRAAIAFPGGRSAGWLSRLLAGSEPLSAEARQWLATETGIAITEGGV